MKFLTIIFCLIISSNAFSNSGGLDKKGCHNNRSTGDYHCHRGSGSQGKESKLGNMSIGNEDYFNLRLANYLGGKTEATYNYDYNINGKSLLIASIRIDIVTDQYVIEGGLDKRSSLDSIQQAVFASTLTGKKPAVAIYDTNGSWGKYEHRIYSTAKELGILLII
tara:strand:+ start:8355 stop:8849 length:495 start_codon:yes stop_codon:yes gene_type:complete